MCERTNTMLVLHVYAINCEEEKEEKQIKTKKKKRYESGFMIAEKSQVLLNFPLIHACQLNKILVITFTAILLCI